MNTVTKSTHTFDTHAATGQTISRGKYTVCPMCHNIKYKKQWYAPDSKVALLANGRKAHSEVRRCPACEMKLKGLYSAVVVIHDVPKNLRYRVESLIENEAENSIYHNPQNRVLEVIETLDGYEVRTTSTKAARAISEKLKAVFKASEVVSELQTTPFHHHKTDVVLKISNYL
jgi:NMD protein affecting ribosome stability and mRNA decay